MDRKSGGKGNKKHGRKKKKPAQQRYTSSRRWEKNKLKRAKKWANKFRKSLKVKVNGILETVNPD